MKKLIIFLPFIFITIVIFSCSSDEVTGNDATRLSGLYKAIVFIEPGSNDEGLDILANNGLLTIQFDRNFTVSGQLIIPENIGSNYAPIDTNYGGTYTLNGDTLRFNNTNDILDNPVVYFIVKDSTIETPVYQGRFALFKIILEKQ